MARSKKVRPVEKKTGSATRRSQASAKALRVAEQLLLAQSEPKTWIEYILKSGRGRWPEAESRMLKKDVLEHNGWTAIEYAEKVIKGRWPELEVCLRTHPQNIEKRLNDERLLEAWYAKTILRGKELESELLRVEHIYVICEYACTVRRRRWVDVEPLLLRKGTWSNILEYAKTCVAPDVWEELDEEVLPQHRENYDFMSEYLRDVKKARCPEFEWKLLELVSESNHDPHWELEDNKWRYVHKYANQVVVGRWQEFEAAVLARFCGDEWQSARGAFDQSLWYAKAKRLSPWPELEAVFTQHWNKWGAEYAGMYAERVIGGKLPAVLHNYMLAAAITDSKDEYAKRYVEFLESL